MIFQIKMNFSTMIGFFSTFIALMLSQKIIVGWICFSPISSKTFMSHNACVPLRVTTINYDSMDERETTVCFCNTFTPLYPLLQTLSVNVKRSATMTWLNLLAPVKEVGPTTETYWPQIDILHGLKIT